MKQVLIAAALILSASAAPVFAADPAPAAAPAAAVLSTSATSIGDLLDNAAAKAVLMKHIPALVSNDQIDMARSMTLKDIQAFAGDTLTDEALAKIDADLAAIK